MTYNKIFLLNEADLTIDNKVKVKSLSNVCGPTV